MDLQSKYRKLDHREHVLARPGMYVGSIEPDVQSTWVFDTESKRMIKREISFTPGLYKIYDEILVNAVDHVTRLKQLKEQEPDTIVTKNIKISINRETGEISVFNDGDGIEVEKHAEHGIWIPEMIFGHLLTSANYDDTDEKTIGGQNGIGAKACNIFSKRFVVETVDYQRSKLYKQEFRDNMSVIEPPKISACKKRPYTTISFVPDYERFKMPNGMTDEMYSLFMKRAYDLCAVTDPDVSVWINDQKLEFKSFERYTDLYLGSKTEHPRFHEKINDRWELVISHTEQMGFEQVSFVNGISTMRGGKHVDYIVNQVTSMLSDMVTKKRKEIQMKPAYIKNYLICFLKCTIGNPTFDSQTKELLTTPVGKFGSKAEIPDKLIDKLYKSALVEKAVSICNVNETKQAKKTDGKKVSQIKGIEKLDDANWAGTAKSNECTLILTEGDSAKSMAIAGLTVVGRDRYGVFPLKGKLMNVKDLTAKRVSDNEEITNIKKIMGLETGKVYTSVDGLRYGRIMALVDSDFDGSHIKGLLFNMFHTLWPSLLKIDGFLTTLLTPVIKATKGTEVLSFYSVSEFDIWKEKSDHARYHIKYYKGLGTSKEKEAKEYFTELKIVDYKWEEDEKDALDLAFNKKRADDRKTWLSGYDRTNVLDYSERSVTYDTFINKELIHFSNYDIERSIPSICDGFKVSQRKVLYGCFKKNIVNEIKVEQLTGYISENSAYHHGEASLSGTIIAMAQDFVGSNNINLLKPNGQFGSRAAASGKNHASPRYIYTELFPITRMIFRKDDEKSLAYRDDDGMIVEPDFYMPIIPMVLVNGAVGIGTGFSTNIPCFNPKEIIGILKRMLRGEQISEEMELVPWYREFTGEIVKVGPGKYASSGRYQRISDTSVRIVELPIGSWTEEFKTDLETFVDSDASIKRYESHYTTRKVDFTVWFACKEACDKYMQVQPNGHTLLENALKLVSTKNLSINNMYLFNRSGQIQKYDSTVQIMGEYYDARLDYYRMRKEQKKRDISQQISVTNAKVRFINQVIDKSIDIASKTKNEIEAGLVLLEYATMDGSYDYLLRMPIYNMSRDKLKELEADLERMMLALIELEHKQVEQIWTEELEQLETEYDKYLMAMQQEYAEGDQPKAAAKKRAPPKKKAN